MRLKRPLKDKTHCQLRPPEGKRRRPLQRRRQKRAGGTPALRKAKRDPCPGQAGFGRIEANAPASLAKSLRASRRRMLVASLVLVVVFVAGIAFGFFVFFADFFPAFV